MQEEIANYVFPVLRAGVEIKQGLQTYPRSFEFAKCHAKLLGLLQETPVPAEIKTEISGESSMIGAKGEAANLNSFLGVRYALACWLDEIFIRDTPWKTLFTNNKMETSLFQTALRFEGFWDQAEKAKNRVSRFSRDTLEVYYLCAMLGFRGKPVDLPSWKETVEAQITDDKEYTPPAGLKVGADVPPLEGHAQMEKWLFALTLVALAFIPVLVLLIFPSNP
jgi:type VI secretion system protein ImpK